jgi:hypothetical protein
LGGVTHDRVFRDGGGAGTRQDGAAPGRAGTRLQRGQIADKALISRDLSPLGRFPPRPCRSV